MLRVDPAGHALPISYASPGSAGKTGEWRTEKPVIDYDKCIGCLMCWLYCPESVIDTEMLDGVEKPVIDYVYCKGCGVCSNVCPVKAIRMITER